VRLIRWTTEASDQLEAAVKHIQQDNPTVARKAAQALVERIEQLAAFPGRGRPGEVTGSARIRQPALRRGVPFHRRRHRNPLHLARGARLALRSCPRCTKVTFAKTPKAVAHRFRVARLFIVGTAEPMNILVPKVMLIIFGGLPGVGKTTVARELARQLGAVHIRIDSIEQAILDSGMGGSPPTDVGYRVGYAVAADNLRVGRTVIADSVNPLAISRDAWLEVASRVQVRAIEIEVVCSDANEHRRRLETRITDFPGSRPLRWHEVVSREYDAWNREHVVIDTSLLRVEQNVRILRGAILGKLLP
jgi:predicted kinase/plasmid stabilization system protein ParE